MTTRREREQQVVVEGRVVADFGRDFLVELADRRQIVCTRKGRKQDAACGDFVQARLTGSAQGSIERVGTRRNILFRSDQWKEKTLAANVDQAVILLAPRPAFSEAFLNLSLVACEAAGIPAIIALNKSDLPEHAGARRTLDTYEKIVRDYPNPRYNPQFLAFVGTYYELEGRHKEAIEEYGYSPIHRRTFKGVKELTDGHDT